MVMVKNDDDDELLLVYLIYVLMILLLLLPINAIIDIITIQSDDSTLLKSFAGLGLAIHMESLTTYNVII